jgi:hypothetical protein
MRNLTELETKELANKDRGWYLKTDTTATYLVTKKGVYSIQEIVDDRVTRVE